MRLYRIQYIRIRQRGGPRQRLSTGLGLQRRWRQPDHVHCAPNDWPAGRGAVLRVQQYALDEPHAHDQHHDRKPWRAVLSRLPAVQHRRPPAVVICCADFVSVCDLIFVFVSTGGLDHDFGVSLRHCLRCCRNKTNRAHGRDCWRCGGRARGSLHAYRCALLAAESTALGGIQIWHKSASR